MRLRQEGDVTIIETDGGQTVAQYPVGVQPADPHAIIEQTKIMEAEERLGERARFCATEDWLEETGEHGTTLGTDSNGRKEVPLFRGLLRYFPAALAEVARVSKIGNDKHRPGQPMGHSRGVSGDHADCILRHLVDLSENEGLDENGVPQVAYIAWRALALAQEWLEVNRGVPIAPAAEFPDDSE